MRTIAFLLIGGQHQFLHGVPVAAALSRRKDMAVVAYVRCPEDAPVLRDMLERLGAGDVRIVEMRFPVWIEQLVGSGGLALPLKTLRLAWWSRRLRKADAIVALERTSSVLRRLPGRCPPLIQIPHGVGGARCAGGSGIDPRFALFQLALVAGAADRRSTLELGLLRDEQVVVVGQVKLAGLRRLGRLERGRLFANERPTIIYNPHFHPRRGTWARYGMAIIDAVRKDGCFNLVVAPHTRLFQASSEEFKRKLEALSDPDWLLIDTGSSRSNDMTYTLGGDIYLGDFSSQVYEWLVHPRPCAFIDQLGDGGVDDSKLPSMWQLGETVTGMDELLPALHRAVGSHGDYRSRQEEILLDAIGDCALPADEMAADAIQAFVGA